MPCELCCSRHPGEIWRDAMFYVIDAADADLPGFVRVIATRHIKEMTDLTPDERARLYQILECVEKTMIEELAPDKVN
ncbi:MAG: HIT family protein [Duodenibacillus sp.]